MVLVLLAIFNGGPSGSPTTCTNRLEITQHILNWLTTGLLRLSWIILSLNTAKSVVSLLGVNAGRLEH